MTSVECRLSALFRDGVSCDGVLELWNICSDAARTAGIPFSSDACDGATQGAYAKLVAGCNLPALRGGGPPYIPEWGDAETAL